MLDIKNPKIKLETTTAKFPLISNMEKGSLLVRFQTLQNIIIPSKITFYSLQISIDFKELCGNGSPQYGLLNEWDAYADLVLEKAFKKTRNKDFDIVQMKNNEGM